MYRYLLLIVVALQLGALYQLDKQVRLLTQQVAAHEKQIDALHIRIDHDALRYAMLNTKFKLFMKEWMRDHEFRNRWIKEGYKE